VEVEGVTLYRRQLPPGYGPQILKLPLRDLPNRGDGLEARLLSETWTPDGGAALGVLLRSVRLAASAECTP
jgi:hypothetical protein